jgi:hypothetical protein
MCAENLLLLACVTQNRATSRRNGCERCRGGGGGTGVLLSSRMTVKNNGKNKPRQATARTEADPSGVTTPKSSN